MSLSKETINEFKEIYKKEFNKELSDSEASEAANNLVGFFQVLHSCHMKEVDRKHRLKKEPKGFYLTDGIYNCSICGCQISNEETWYDKWGIKCMLCQKAVESGDVPGFVCKEHDSWYPMWRLKDKFGISHPTARKMVRQGILKARIVKNAEGKPCEYVFLKKENPHLIDPDRKSPTRKAYDRNYNKIMDIKIKEERKRLREEFEKRRKKRKNRNRYR